MYNLHHKMNCRVFYFDITEDQLDPGASLEVTIKESWPQVLWEVMRGLRMQSPNWDLECEQHQL